MGNLQKLSAMKYYIENIILILNMSQLTHHLKTTVAKFHLKLA